MTKVLMISTDAKILEEGSEVRARMAEYAALFDELHIIVFSGKGFKEKIKIASNAFAYPTNSVSKLFYVTDAKKIGGAILAGSFSGAQSSAFGTKFSPTDSVITTQDPFETGIVGMMLSRATGVPLHVQIHTDFYSPYFKKSALNRVRIALAKRTLARADAVRAVSERIRASLAPDIRVKTSVLPIFADIEAIKSAPILAGVSSASGADLRAKYPQFKKIALIASRLTKEKNIAAAIEAFAKVRETYPDAGLVIVGEGPLEEELRAESRELGIENAVIFEPWADRATLISSMKTCDAFISASLYEGYGLSMLEAHAAGARLVVTDAGIAPLLVAAEMLAAPGTGHGTVAQLAKNLEAAFAGQLKNRSYSYPYSSKGAYGEEYKKDVERALEIDTVSL